VAPERQRGGAVEVEDLVDERADGGHPVLDAYDRARERG